MRKTAIETFVKKYIDKKIPISIEELREDYLKAYPSAHPDANSPRYSEKGMEYFIMRLPQEIIWTEKITISGSKSYIKKFQTNKNYKKVYCHKRKRPYYFSPKKKHLIIGINSISDINDIIPILCGLSVELEKMQKLFDKVKRPLSAFSTKHRIKLIEHLESEDTHLLQNLRQLINMRNFSIELKKCSEKYYKERAAIWGKKLKKVIEECNPESVYVILANSHSIINSLSGFPRQNRNLIWKWASKQSRFKPIFDDVSAKKTWEEDALYFLQRQYLQVNKQAETDFDSINLSSGIKKFIDEDFNGPIFHWIDISKINPDTNDPRIFDNALYNLQDKKAFILNVDFTMGGYQAKYILQEILDNVPMLRGLYIFGKAGSMEGNIGDVILPFFTYDIYSGNFIFYPNDLKGKYLRRYLRNGAPLEAHGMLTVYGVLLQNKDYLDYYFKQNLTGIEMEGGPYFNAIVRHLEKEKYEKKLLHISNPPFDMGIAYYVSDTPYHQGKTLGTLGRHGLESVYAVSIAVLNRILIKEASINIR